MLIKVAAMPIYHKIFLKIFLKNGVTWNREILFKAFETQGLEIV